MNSLGYEALIASGMTSEEAHVEIVKGLINDPERLAVFDGMAGEMLSELQARWVERGLEAPWETAKKRAEISRAGIYEFMEEEGGCRDKRRVGRKIKVAGLVEIVRGRWK